MCPKMLIELPIQRASLGCQQSQVSGQHRQKHKPIETHEVLITTSGEALEK